jgi:hypothetical protein
MKKLYMISILAIVAALLMSACGSGAAPTSDAGAPSTQAANKPVAQPTEKPAEQPAEEPAAVQVEAATPEALDISSVSSGLGELNSYKASFTMSFDGKENGQPKTGKLSFTEEFVKDPPAKRTVITGLGAMSSNDTGTPEPGQVSGIETIEVGGKQYSKMGDICSQVTADSGPQANTMLDPNSLIGGVRGTQRVGNETVNGVPTVHYKIDATGLETLGYFNGSGDVWVAEPGNYVVKYAFQATGSDKFFGSSDSEGTIKWDYEVSDVNQPIVIQAPENCGGAAEDIPMMSDAQDRAAFGGMSTYSTPSKFADVSAFYEKEMKARGWTEKEGSDMGATGMSAKNYTKDGRTVQVVITEDTSSGKTTVMITEEK